MYYGELENSQYNKATCTRMYKVITFKLLVIIIKTGILGKYLLLTCYFSSLRIQLSHFPRSLSLGERPRPERRKDRRSIRRLPLFANVKKWVGSLGTEWRGG